MTTDAYAQRLVLIHREWDHVKVVLFLVLTPPSLPSKQAPVFQMVLYGLDKGTQ